MAEWVLVGDTIMNVENIEWVERVNVRPLRVLVHLGSGKVVELTDTVALMLWKYIDSERLKFLNLEAPERDFSGT